MKDFFLVILSILLLFLLFGILCILFARRLVPNHHEWLLVLSHHDWKRAPKLIEEICELKKAKHSFGLMGIIYSDLDLLIDEKLVEERHVLLKESPFPVTEHRLTINGLCKKNNKINHPNEDIHSGFQTQ